MFQMEFQWLSRVKKHFTSVLPCYSWIAAGWCWKIIFNTVKMHTFTTDERILINIE